MQLPTNEDLVDLIIAESRDIRVKEGDPLTDAEMKAEMMADLEEEPAAQVMMQRLAKAVFTLGYNAGVAGRLPTMTLGVRRVVAEDGMFQMVFRYSTAVDLKTADQEWTRFIMGEPEPTNEPAK